MEELEQKGVAGINAANDRPMKKYRSIMLVENGAKVVDILRERIC